MTQPELAVGQVWKHKRNGRRRVEITDVVQHDGVGPVYAYVTRNTSRRKQPISETTLRKEYVLVIVDARVAH